MVAVKSSDLQSRLDCIRARMADMQERMIRDAQPTTHTNDIRELASCVDYLARILAKHLETGER